METRRALVVGAMLPALVTRPQAEDSIKKFYMPKAPSSQCTATVRSTRISSTTNRQSANRSTTATVELTPVYNLDLRRDSRRFNRAAGWILTATGGVLAGRSFALNQLGDHVLPNMSLETPESMRDGMLLYATMLIVTGAASILLNLP